MPKYTETIEGTVGRVDFLVMAVEQYTTMEITSLSSTPPVVKSVWAKGVLPVRTGDKVRVVIDVTKKQGLFKRTVTRRKLKEKERAYKIEVLDLIGRPFATFRLTVY